LRRDWRVQCIAASQDHALRQHVPGHRQALGQQLDAAQMRRREAQAQQLQQVAAGTTAHFQQAQPRQVAQPGLGEQAEHRALPLLHRLQHIGALHAVAASVAAPRITLGQRGGFALVGHSAPKAPAAPAPRGGASRLGAARRRLMPAHQ